MPEARPRRVWKAAIGVRRRLKRKANASRDTLMWAWPTPWWVPASQVFRVPKTRWVGGRRVAARAGAPQKWPLHLALCLDGLPAGVPHGPAAVLEAGPGYFIS